MVVDFFCLPGDFFRAIARTFELPVLFMCTAFRLIQVSQKVYEQSAKCTHTQHEARNKVPEYNNIENALYNVNMVDLRQQLSRYGSQEWARLAVFLNGKAAKARSRIMPAGVKRVLVLLVKMQELAAVQAANDSSAIEAIEADVNNLLAKYRLHFVVKRENYQAPFMRVEPAFITRSSRQLKQSENEAVGMIVDAARLGMLTHIRQCELSSCRRWFVASRSDQRFCDASCTQKFHTSKPDFKKTRAMYAREWRAKQKAGNEVQER